MIWRAVNAARRENLVAEGRPEPLIAGQGIARRAFLKALAATFGGSAMPGAALALGRASRVAILGGGIAGLTALDRLIEAGIDATLYEARGRIGGRMHTVGGDGAPVFERGGQLVNTDHADMHALARKFGVGLVDRKAGTHSTMILAEGRAIPEAELVAKLRAIVARIDADAELLDKDFDRVAPDFDRLSMKSYLDRHAALIPEPWVRRLLESTARTEYGVEPERASALELLFNLPTIDGEKFEVLGGSDERFLIAGGSAALPAAIAARHGAHIRQRKRATRIDAGPGRSLRIGFADGTHAMADRVIVAVPGSLVKSIAINLNMPADWRAFINALELGRNEKVQLATGAKPWQATPLGSGGEAWTTDANAEAALGWDASVQVGDAPGVWNWFMGGDQVGAPALADLERRFAPAAPLTPEQLARPVDRTAWHRDPHTMGGYVNYPPGFLTRFGGKLWLESETASERQACAIGRVSFVGEHVSDAFPGYMNGAAQTGRMAAEALIAAA